MAIGEPFTRRLTCAVRDDDGQRASRWTSRGCASAVVQLAPFEVLGGTHPGGSADADASVLPVPLHAAHHRSATRSARTRVPRHADAATACRLAPASDAVEGRDRTYVVPGQPVRVLSLVPVERRRHPRQRWTRASRASRRCASARARCEHRRARPRRARALSLWCRPSCGWCAARGATRGRPATARRTPAAAGRRARSSPPSRRESRSGWTPELVSRALRAARLAAACALGSPHLAARMPRSVTSARRAPAVRRGWLRRSTTSVSSARQRDRSRRRAARTAADDASRRAQLLEDLRRRARGVHVSVVSARRRARSRRRSTRRSAAAIGRRSRLRRASRAGLDRCWSCGSRTRDPAEARG